MKSGVIEEIERYVNLDRESLLERGTEALLRERKRKMMLEKHQILSRYGVETSRHLEEKIRSGNVVEHPAWEELITLENLEDGIRKLDGYIRNLQQTD